MEQLDIHDQIEVDQEKLQQFVKAQKEVLTAWCCADDETKEKISKTLLEAVKLEKGFLFLTKPILKGEDLELSSAIVCPLCSKVCSQTDYPLHCINCVEIHFQKSRTGETSKKRKLDSNSAAEDSSTCSFIGEELCSKKKKKRRKSFRICYTETEFLTICKWTHFKDAKMKEWMQSKIGKTANKKLDSGTCLKCGKESFEYGVVVESVEKPNSNFPLHLEFCGLSHLMDYCAKIKQGQAEKACVVPLEERESVLLLDQAKSNNKFEEGEEDGNEMK